METDDDCGDIAQSVGSASVSTKGETFGGALPPYPPEPPPDFPKDIPSEWLTDPEIFRTLSNVAAWEPVADARPRAFSVAQRIDILRKEVIDIAAEAEEDLEDHLRGLLRSTETAPLPDVEADRVEVSVEGPPARLLRLGRASVVCPGKFDFDGITVSADGGEWSRPSRVLTYEESMLRVSLPDIEEKFVIPVDDVLHTLSHLRAICEGAQVIHEIPKNVLLFGAAGIRPEDRARELAIHAARTAITELNRNAVRLDEAFSVTAEAITDRISDRAVEAARQRRFRDVAADARAKQQYRLIHATRALQRRPSLERVWQESKLKQKQLLVDCQSEEVHARKAIEHNAGLGLDVPLCVEHLERASYTPIWMLCTEGLPNPPIRPRKELPADPSGEWLEARAVTSSEYFEWWEDATETFRQQLAPLRRRHNYKLDNLQWLNDPTRWRYSKSDVWNPPELGPDLRKEVLCCMPCQMARQYHAASAAYYDEQSEPSICLLLCCIGACLLAPCGGAPAAVLLTRTEIRRKYDIREDTRWDLSDVCCGWPSLLVQHWKELRYRGRDPGGRLVKEGREEPPFDSIPHGHKVPRFAPTPHQAARTLAVLAGVAVSRFLVVEGYVSERTVSVGYGVLPDGVASLLPPSVYQPTKLEYIEAGTTDQDDATPFQTFSEAGFGSVDESTPVQSCLIAVGPSKTEME